MNVLFYAPVFEPVVKDIFAWANNLVEASKILHNTTLLIDKNEVTREVYLSALRDNELVFIIAHGEPNAFGYHEEVNGMLVPKITSTSEDKDLYSGKIVCALSCNLASDFGLAISKNATFIGYTEPIILVNNRRVVSYNRSSLLRVVELLIEGHSTQDAFNEALINYNKILDKLAGEDDPVLQLTYTAIAHNRDSFVHLGEDREVYTDSKMNFVIGSLVAFSSISILVEKVK